MSYRANREKTPTKAIQSVATAWTVNIKTCVKCFSTIVLAFQLGSGYMYEENMCKHVQRLPGASSKPKSFRNVVANVLEAVTRRI